ncbi:hypothetical protein BC940DRAFT_294725 [Gongronella butleri]|nr:hypothetical protein BC940DRAFT_294725 [Gongronella butleri]
MSFAGYLFGNVDEQGRLDNDLDADLRETLQHVDANVMSKIFNTDTLGLGDDAGRSKARVAVAEEEEEDDDDEDDALSALKRSTIPTEHAKDAVDYSDFNETVPDDMYYRRGMSMLNNKAPLSRMRMISDNYDDDEEEEDEDVAKSSPASFPAPPISSPGVIVPQKRQQHPADVDIHAIFPAFEKNRILRFSDLFMTQFKQPRKLQPNKNVIFGDGTEYDVNRDDQVLFNRSSKTERLKWRIEQIAASKRRKLDTGQHETRRNQDQYISSDDDQANVDTMAIDMKDVPPDVNNDKLYNPVMLRHWEDQIKWQSDDDTSNALDEIDFKHINRDLYDGDWLDAVRWNNQKMDDDHFKINLDLNDPHMLFDCEQVEATKAQLPVPKHVKKGRKPLPRPVPKVPIIYPVDTEPHSKLPLNRFNLSGDKNYETHYTGRLVRVRQTIGELDVSHALPAVKLNPVHFKTRLSKAELRSFHRHQFQPAVGSDISFSRVKAFKRKKKDKKKPSTEFMRTTKDMSLKETCNYVLTEYSEENPPIVSNQGMGTLIINYYRKTEPKDDYAPVGDYGEPFVLDIGDTSPFLNFGNVEPGQSISMYHNNLVRAPLFRQDVKHTDFLFIRSTFRGQVKYYLREIPAIFVMGQTYPVQEVPGPQSRKVTSTVKNRLQVVAYRMIKRNSQRRLKMSKLAQRFPEYTDMHIRQRLKEFLEFHRRTKDGSGGYWKVRGGGEPPDEEALRKMVTPEMVCLYESMLVGERHLQDLGYGDVNDDEDGDVKLEVEQQLAPWFITRNFINASQGKAMLKLYGAGDPTGRGEGFSFIRVSMKDVFLRAGESAYDRLAEIEARPKSAHRYNVAEQQQIYKEEIARIWMAQLESLTTKEEPTLSDHESESEVDDVEGQSPFMSPSPAPYSRQYERSSSAADFDDDDMSATGSVSSRTSYHINSTNKSLVIKRLKRTETGDIDWVSEIINDPVVIKAYLQQRSMIEQEAEKSAALEAGMDSSEQKAKMQARIRMQLNRLKRNAERRRQRQLGKQAMLAENPVLGLIRGSRNEGAMRRCGNCGAIGHMKTNKKCPMFYVVNGGQPPSAGSTPQASTPQPPSMMDDASSLA